MGQRSERGTPYIHLTPQVLTVPWFGVTPQNPPGPSPTPAAPTFACEVQCGVIDPSVIRNHCSVNSHVLFGQLEGRMSVGGVSLGSRRNDSQPVGLGWRPALALHVTLSETRLPGPQFTQLAWVSSNAPSSSSNL